MVTVLGERTVSVFDSQSIKRFLCYRKNAGVKLATLQRYRNALQSARAFFGDKMPESTQSMERWRDYLLQEGYALNTVNCIASALNVYLVYIGRMDLCLRGKKAPGMSVQPERKGPLLFDSKEIETFLHSRQAEGTELAMMKRYRKALQSARDFCEKSQPVTAASLLEWRAYLLGIGYAPNTVNCMASALNTYLVYIGYPDWCLPRLRATARKERGRTEHEDSA